LLVGPFCFPPFEAAVIFPVVSDVTQILNAIEQGDPNAPGHNLGQRLIGIAGKFTAGRKIIPANAFRLTKLTTSVLVMKKNLRGWRRSAGIRT
jgi:hypothetical protein